MNHNNLYISIFNDYKQNFVSINEYAKCYNITKDRAQRMIDTGRILNNMPEVELIKQSGRY